MSTPRASHLFSALLPLAVCALGALGSAQTALFQFPLQTSQVVPPVGTGASGSGMLSLNPLTGNVTVAGSYAGLAGTQTLVHLHGPALAGASAPVVATLTGSGGTSGSFSGLALLNVTQSAEVLAGKFYLDVHTTTSPDGELRGQVCRLAVAVTRNSGANPQSYTCSAPVFGGTFSASVDLSTTGHTFAALFAFGSPADVLLTGGQRLLCIDLAGGGEVLTGAGLGPAPGPLATFQLAAPSSLAFCNLTFSSQAIHFGGVVPFALSNARDVSLGF